MASPARPRGRRARPGRRRPRPDRPHPDPAAGGGGERTRHRRAPAHRGGGARGAPARARRHRGRGPAEDRGVAGGEPEGRARLRAGRARPAALRRRRREPDLDPRLRPAQQLPPARGHRADRRLPLRQRGRLRRLRVARAAHHQAPRGLQGRQRPALRRLHPGRRHQLREQDRLRRRADRAAQRGGLLRLPQELRRHRPGLRPLRPLRGAERHRARRLPPARRAAPAPRLRELRLPAARRHHRAARPRLRAERGEPAGRPDPGGDGPEPAPAQPGERALQGRSRLRLRPRRPHGAHPARRRPGARVVHPAQLPGPRSPAVLRDHRRHHLQLRHRAALRADRAARRDGQPVHRRPAVPRHPADRRQLRQRGRQPGRQDQGPAQHRQHGGRLPGGPARPDAHLHRDRGRPRRLHHPRGPRPLPLQRQPVRRGGLRGRLAAGRLRVEARAVGAGLRQREPRLRAPAPPRDHRPRPARGQPGPARGAEVVAVRGRHPRHGGRAPGLGRLGLRHRAVGRDPERQRPALPGRAVHHPALPQHRPLAPHRRRGRGATSCS